MIRFVYVVGAVPERVKVGVSNNPRARITEMQVGSPVELQIFHQVGFPYWAAEEIEGAVHQELRGGGRRVRGEWFDIHADEARMIIERLGPPIVADGREKRRASLDLFERLSADYDISPWAEEAVSQYRQATKDPALKRRLGRMNRVILDEAGEVALNVLRLVGERGELIATAFRRVPWAKRKAEAELAAAINALSRAISREREATLADEIEEIERLSRQARAR